jgi:hypothetical protein
MSATAVLLAAAILVLVAWRARAVMRAERHLRHGGGPDRGVTTIRAEYSSGIGGGEAREYTVPKDPQAYARLFVPKTKPKG